MFFVRMMGDVFPELKDNEKKIKDIIKDEEATFQKILVKTWDMIIMKKNYGGKDYFFEVIVTMGCSLFILYLIIWLKTYTLYETTMDVLPSGAITSHAFMDHGSETMMSRKSLVGKAVLPVPAFNSGGPLLLRLQLRRYFSELSWFQVLGVTSMGRTSMSRATTVAVG